MMRYIILLISVFLSFKSPASDVFISVPNEIGVPAKLLYAMALNESGTSITGKYAPWPWTLNICGKSLYLDSKEDAVEFLNKAIEASCSVDIGLMQIHWQSHKKQFKSIEDALDPLTNVRVGALILKEQYLIDHNWFMATGRYHSPGNKGLATGYRNRVFAILERGLL